MAAGLALRGFQRATLMSLLQSLADAGRERCKPYRRIVRRFRPSKFSLGTRRAFHLPGVEQAVAHAAIRAANGLEGPLQAGREIEQFEVEAREKLCDRLRGADDEARQQFKWT